MSKIPSLHKQLAEVTLADLITFNRRRKGEVAKLTIDDYNKKTKVDMKSDVQGTGQDTINNVDEQPQNTSCPLLDTINNVNEQPQDVSHPMLDTINYRKYMPIIQPDFVPQATMS